ncbi:hypothetical protein DFH29DRAFT_1005463 [Suillus ampliporus]|nr:hypothetical protein DFH29DRAFT_1005463 [Suillus ampliporus]
MSNTNIPLPSMHQLLEMFPGPSSHSCRDKFTISLCRPSVGWLQRGGWIDGGIDPPHRYSSNEEMMATRKFWTGVPEFPPPPVPVQADIPMSVPLPMEQISPAADVSAKVNVPIPLAVVEGHNVSVQMIYSAQVTGPVSRGSKLIMKKAKLISSDTIVLEDISRAVFVKIFLAIHELEDRFAVGAISGPSFKMYWTGSVGGKAALLKKNKRVCQVGVEFDVDEMDGFRIRTRPILALDNSQDGEDELESGTQVPHVEAFSDQTQLHGAIIIQLKAKWPCAEHQGESGGIGYCYVSPTGEHVGLNSRRLKIWVSAVAAYDAMKNEPPNMVDFDRVQGNATSEAASLIMAIMPLITGILQKCPCSPSLARLTCHASIPLSPLPASGSELHACLRDFAEATDIDLASCEDSLVVMEFIPDIIPDIPVARLCEIMGVVEGRLQKLQMFCKDWNNRLCARKAQAKRRRNE